MIYGLDPNKLFYVEGIILIFAVWFMITDKKGSEQNRRNSKRIR
jgi:hypothetical protein